MNCKYPKENKMYYACIICDEKNICKVSYLPLTDSNISVPSEDVILSTIEANKIANNVAYNILQKYLK